MNLFDAHQDMVQWMKAFGQETPESPCVPDSKIIQLRADLIQEEVEEELLPALDELFDDAIITDTCCEQDDFEQVLDGLADSLFVIIGTFVALGVPTEEVYKEISRSNWTKLWTGKEIENVLGDEESFDPSGIIAPYIYKDEDGTIYKDLRTGTERRFLVKNSQGKVIKSPSFSPPDLSKWRIKS